MLRSFLCVLECHTSAGSKCAGFTYISAYLDAHFADLCVAKSSGMYLLHTNIYGTKFITMVLNSTSTVNNTTACRTCSFRTPAQTQSYGRLLSVKVQEHSLILSLQDEGLSTHEIEGKASIKRQRRPSTLAQLKLSTRMDENVSTTKSHDKKRPTLRFSEMIRNDWTTFSRDRAHDFDAVESVVYAPWKDLRLSEEQLEPFGVNVKAVVGEVDSMIKSRKSTWCVTSCVGMTIRHLCMYVFVVMYIWIRYVHRAISLQRVHCARFQFF